MTRQEHLEWCKGRALEYVYDGNTTKALTSMFSDLSEHEDTADHPAIQLGLRLLLMGELSTPEEMRKFIQGFN